MLLIIKSKLNKSYIILHNVAPHLSTTRSVLHAPPANRPGRPTIELSTLCSRLLLPLLPLLPLTSWLPRSSSNAQLQSRLLRSSLNASAPAAPAAVSLDPPFGPPIEWSRCAAAKRVRAAVVAAYSCCCACAGGSTCMLPSHTPVALLRCCWMGLGAWKGVGGGEGSRPAGHIKELGEGLGGEGMERNGEAALVM